MRSRCLGLRSMLAALLALTTLAPSLVVVPRAFAVEDEDPGHPMLRNARIASALRTPVVRVGTSAVTTDTTFVGFTPGHSGDNYWSIWSGNNAIAGTWHRPPARGGIWDFEPPYGDVHDDSLQGWWSVRLQYLTTLAVTIQDYQRPWNCLDIGNDISYVYGAGKRTTGVIGAWHVDGGNTIVPPASTNWTGETDGGVKWAPLTGSASAWMGLRRHGDDTYVDPITHNPFNEDLDWMNGPGSLSLGGTDKKFPGYNKQVDQMLYRDIDVTSATSVTVSFQYRTAMSTSFGTNNPARRGWFQHDPLTVIRGVANANFISNPFNDDVDGPADSFMVYLGAPAEGSVLLSDGNTHTIYDPLRRWFGEVLRSNESLYKQILSTTGTSASTQSSGSITISSAQINAWKAANAGNPAAANRIRLVFRVKTNSVFDDEDQNLTSYSSAGRGAAQVDEVSIQVDANPPTVSHFESPSEIDNTQSALDAWRSTGKPPAAYFHIRQLSPSTGLVYQDICGPVGSPTRLCDMQGQIVSMGNFDRNEAADGPLGTPEQEQWKGMVSPTINLCTGSGPNNMGLDGSNPRMDAVATDDYYLDYEIYTGVFDLMHQGNAWLVGAQCFPGATTPTGAGQHKRWGDLEIFYSPIFNPNAECFRDLLPLGNTFRTSNATGIPDSIRIFLETLSECFRFGVNSEQLGGGYFDNISLDIVDQTGASAPFTVETYKMLTDTFPFNDSVGFAGDPAAFDTTTALIKNGNNYAPNTNDLNRFDVPGDSSVVLTRGNSIRVDLVFRILPGPGNYVSPALGGNSQLKKVPIDATPISGSPAAGSTNFWENYLYDNGAHGTPGGHPTAASGPLAGEKVWSPNVWNSARMDTAEIDRFNVQKKSIVEPVDTGLWMTAYHETELADPNRGALGIARNICFMADTSGSTFTQLCGSGNTGGANYPPAWVTVLPHSRTGWNGSTTTNEGTKIIPDGLLTPGAHVEYFFRREDLVTHDVQLVPDTSVVYPQLTDYSMDVDAHRWEEFSVLPDRWKSPSYTHPVLGTVGHGSACMLYVDMDDTYGDERTWVGIADSIGATRVEKFGAHNGWHAAGNGSNINDPSGFVAKHGGQPGTTWDLYHVRYFPLDQTASRLGSRGGPHGYSHSDPANSQIDGKTSRQGPTLEMLQAYYKVLMLLTGDVKSPGTLLGPFTNTSQNDCKLLEDFLSSGNTETPDRGLIAQGSAFVSSADDPTTEGTHFLTTYLGVQTRHPNYRTLSGNYTLQTALLPQTALPPTSDTYGVASTCDLTMDVLDRSGALSSETSELVEYDPVGGSAPYIAGVLKSWTSDHPWISAVMGWDVANLDQLNGHLSTYAREVFARRLFQDVFTAVCDIAGPGPDLDVPGVDERLTDFIRLQGNPSRNGLATVGFGLASSGRVELSVYDVAGRKVRTLADRVFPAGTHTVVWDGLDGGGARAARGVYFVRLEAPDRRFESTRKLVMVR